MCYVTDVNDGLRLNVFGVLLTGYSGIYIETITLSLDIVFAWFRQ